MSGRAGAHLRAQRELGAHQAPPIGAGCGRVGGGSSSGGGAGGGWVGMCSARPEVEDRSLPPRDLHVPHVPALEHP